MAQGVQEEPPPDPDQPSRPPSSTASITQHMQALPQRDHAGQLLGLQVRRGPML